MVDCLLGNLGGGFPGNWTCFLRMYGSNFVFVSFFALSDGGGGFLIFLFEKVRQAGNLKCDVQEARKMIQNQEMWRYF